MQWYDIGYFPKRRVTRARWVSPWPSHPDAVFPAPDAVEELCSVSGCIARRPDSLGEGWNQFRGYGDAAAAWRSLSDDERPAFEVFAYRLAAALFRDGATEPLEVVEADLYMDPPPIAPGETRRRLGYDAVELTEGVSFGCSPLSCNGMSFRTEVNRYFLVDAETAAFDLAREFSDSKPEPGPYVVVEVSRVDDV
ncbi:MAG: hypothetical protein ACRC1K_17360 [Planctomycetia bacterium]